MKRFLTILLLCLSTLSYSQDTTSDKKEEPNKRIQDQPQPQKQEEESTKNPFQIGPYKNGEYEYYGETQRETTAKEKEKGQQTQ